MKNETDFKRVFCDSVDKQRGYTFKIAMSSVSGLPDLYCSMPGFVPLLLEAKFIKVGEYETFERKIPYRKMQQLVMENCNRPHAGRHLVAYGLIGVQYKGRVHCLITHPGVQVVTHKDLSLNPVMYGEITHDGVFDVSAIFNNKGVAKMPQLQNSNHEEFTLPIVETMIE